MLVEHKINNHLTWVETNRLTDEEQISLLTDYKLPEETIDYVTDIYERSNYITDEENGIDLVIIHIPTKLDQDNRYVSRPVSLLTRGNQIFSFNEGESKVNYEKVKKIALGNQAETPMIFLLEAVNELVDSYLPVLRVISRERHQLDDLLTQKVRNKDLVRLSYLQQTLTFLLSATANNLDVLNQIEQSKQAKSFDDETNERLEDAMIEANQIAHMTEIESGIVDRISQIFDSLMNNNLNDTMQFLTLWSLALAIPTIITGFYGMNIDLPVNASKYEWIYVVVLSIILMIWLIVMFNKRRK